MTLAKHRYSNSLFFFQVLYDYEDRINQAVFPGLQGGLHNHTITGLAIALKQAITPEYRAYPEQVLSNCSKFAQAFSERDTNREKKGRTKT
ncbi:serine hydroxymethyltransferase, mitochondrial-like [Arachis ipaensis]|uniref:serine hydroxymethyltransferase, mitochondrial-like n=1 Tax=Arachis ipaensis TaxID=130454 RepID=UPI000A2B82ED|nr:serine hydroxymethyltransferase, mitochondrial-like [Arachis ipaensis]